MRSFCLSFLLMLGFLPLCAQTDFSLFVKKDGVQVGSLSSAEGATYKTVGHHGPAVENLQMALRLYFNDSGAIDVYNKRKDGLELARYRWYPTEEQQAAESAGVDEYYVGKTVGLGGIRLEDGGEYVKPVATEGRTARVGKIRRGSFAEIQSRGVVLSDGKVDLKIRVEVRDGSRWADVKATASRKVRFATGLNYPSGARLHFGKGLIAAWGIHPADVSKSPNAIGSAIRFNVRTFSTPTRQKEQVLVISRRTRAIHTRVFSASASQVLSAEGGQTSENWQDYLEKMLSK